VRCPDPDPSPCIGEDDGHVCSLSSDVCVPLIFQSRGSPPAVRSTRVSLIGDPVIEIMAGEPYGKCADGAPIAIICDHGASAIDDVDGDLSSMVQVCSPGFYYHEFGVRGCNLDTVTPGPRSIVYTVPDSLGGASATAIRLLWILEPCTLGEARCTDRSCSSGGICIESEVGHDVSKVSTHPPPRLTLKTAPFQPSAASVVRVPVGDRYIACDEASSMSLPSTLCDPGERQKHLMKVENVALQHIRMCSSRSPCMISDVWHAERCKCYGLDGAGHLSSDPCMRAR
jgi:hypothetical protein